MLPCEAHMHAAVDPDDHELAKLYHNLILTSACRWNKEDEKFMKSICQGRFDTTLKGEACQRLLKIVKTAFPKFKGITGRQKRKPFVRTFIKV